MNRSFKLLIIALLIGFSSCEDDDYNAEPTPNPEPTGDYVDGTFVLNQGSQDFGSVTYLSEDFSEVEQEVFSTVNPGENLGIFVQSIFFDQEDRAYIISNGSNLISIVDKDSFEKVGEITTGLDVPRYGVVIDGKAYITNQASFTTSEDDFVAVIDLETLALETTIPFNEVVENIISDGTKIYVQNAAFGSGSSVSIINPDDNSIENQIDTGDALQSIYIDSGSLFALHASGMDRINLNTQEVASTIELPSNISGAKNLRIYNGSFYYTFENKVYTTSLSESSLGAIPLIEYESNSAFGVMYGFAVLNDFIFIGDAGDFASDGFVEIYDLNGNLVFETSVGVAPCAFYQ